MNNPNKLKWFWRINYLLTFYKVLILLNLLLPIAGFHLKNNWLNYITTTSFAFIVSCFIEWIQIPAVLIVLIFCKSERQPRHYLYLIFLSILALSTLVFYGLLLGSLGDM